MLLHNVFRRASGVCAVTIAVALTPTWEAAASPLRTTSLHAQFGGLGGMATGKLLQEFHLPSSPADLLQFVLQYALQQKIGNTLPLNLNAGDAYPTVEDALLPGGPFHGSPLAPTLSNLRTALPPGDYVVPVMAYCTQYSVHRPGQGTAYKLAPIKGTEAEAIATLLWRGTLAGKSPQELQATNWAIQSGMTYSAMPKPYQALIDDLIPEYRNNLRGNMLDIVQSTYAEVTSDPRKALQNYVKEKYNKTLPLMLLPKFNIPAPPLETVLAKLGPAGQLALDAKKQSAILTTAYTTRERGEQVLFEGQGTTGPPQPAGAGPWTVRIPGQVYMRFIIQGGNMQKDNLMQLRVLPAPQAAITPAPQLHLASLPLTPAAPLPPPTSDNLAPSSVERLLGVKTAATDTSLKGVKALTADGVIGYAVGGAGAQALVAVASPVPAQKPTATLQVLIHNQTTYKTIPANAKTPVTAGLCMYVAATINDPDHVYTRYGWVQKVTVTTAEQSVPRTFIDNYNSSDPSVDTAPSQAWLYRPTETDSAWAAAAHEIDSKYDLLYRDAPNRPFGEASRLWHAETALVGVNGDGSPDVAAPLATFTYGWSKTSGPLQPTPVTLNGIAWQGIPSLRGAQASYLCDPNVMYDTGSGHNMPVEPETPPANYVKTPGYHFVP